MEAIIPTANRPDVLFNTLKSISEQNILPEIIHIVDASSDSTTENKCKEAVALFNLNIEYHKAKIKGAASQRMQALPFIHSEFVLFLDDDIIIEQNCFHLLQTALQNNTDAGGVNAMVTNQQYHNPGKLTAFMYRLMNGTVLKTYAGKCIGPGWNLLPEDKGEFINESEWLNTTCTLYRAKALPNPLFPDIFKGYSLMEDLALSLEVGKKWKLYNVRHARIFHDSQPGDHKNSAFRVSRMEMINRHYIMKTVLRKTKFKDYIKLFIFEKWNILTSLNSSIGRKVILKTISGKISALFSIIFNSKSI